MWRRRLELRKTSRTRTGLYADRIVGGHCDHCYFGGIIVAGLGGSQKEKA
jgi:hypothetical protein